MMPIWLEVLILSLCSYMGGMAIGWLLWGRGHADTGEGIQ
jgi:hypothetical protein